MLQHLKKVLSFNGVSISIGTAGGIFGILMFIFPSIQTAKADWPIVLGIIYILISIIVILLKLIFDISRSVREVKNTTELSSIPFRFSTETNSFLVHSNTCFEYNTLLTIFIDDSGFEIPIGIGFVNNRQEKIIQIFVYKIADSYKELMEKIQTGDPNMLKKIVIKSNLNQTIGEEFFK